MSLRWKILLPIAVLAAMLLFYQGVDVGAHLHAVERVRGLGHADAVAAALIEASGALAAERGSTNGLIAAPDNAGLRSQAQAARTRAEAALARAEAALQAVGPLPAETERGRQELRARHDRLRAMRQAVDGIQGAANRPTQAAWFATASDTINAAAQLRRRIEGAALSSTTNLVPTLMATRDALWESTEYAGRQRGLIAGAIGSGERLAPDQLRQIGYFRGHVRSSRARWVMARNSAMPAALLAALDQAEAGYYARIDPILDRVIAASVAGQPYPMTPEAWFSEITGLMQTLDQATAAANAAIAQATGDAQGEAQADAWLHATALVFGVLLALGVALLVIRGILRPLGGAIDAIRRLADGDLDSPLPAATGSDEVGALVNATRHFQEQARANAQFLAEQAKLREAASNSRVLAMREMADLIDQEASAAVRGMTATAVELAERAQAMDRMAQHTQAEAGAVDAATGEGLNAADQAAGGNQQLSAAIGEVTQQITRTAQATRAVVERTEQARQIFATLAESVNKIGEVTRLIGDVAGQTNLLALNATIEAARAGGAGKGFAVVAAEVKTLAGQTARSTDEIASRVSAIEAATREALAAIEGMVASVSEIDQVATSVAAAMEEHGAATGAIAEAVGAAAGSARTIAGRARSMVELTAQSTTTAAGVSVSAGSVRNHVEALQATLREIVQTTLAHAERRRHARIRLDLPAQLELGNGTTLAARVTDVSSGGAHLTLPPGAPEITGGTVTIGTLPRRRFAIVDRHGDVLHCTFPGQSADEQREMEAAISALTARPRAAA